MQFDTKSEVTELGTSAAKKVFEYTYLARGPMSIKARELSIAYFDPSSGRYIEKKITVPGIEVSGVAAVANTPSASGSTQGQNKTPMASGSENDFLSNLFSSNDASTSGTGKKIEKNLIGLVGPSLSNNSRWFDRWFDLVNLGLGVALLSFCGKWYY